MRLEFISRGRASGSEGRLIEVLPSAGQVCLREPVGLAVLRATCAGPEGPTATGPLALPEVGAREIVPIPDHGSRPRHRRSPRPDLRAFPSGRYSTDPCDGLSG